MKLSKDTLNIIKNFAGINGNLLFKPGNKISTVNVGKTVFASTSVLEQFTTECGIYDLNEFLGALSLFNDPDMEFNDKYVVIKEGNNAIKYYGAAVQNMVVPTKDIIFPEAEINLSLEASVLEMIMRTAPILKTEDVTFIGNGTTVSVNVGDKKNATGNTFTNDLAPSTARFNVNLKIDNLKMIPGAYDVSISSKKISRFKSKTSDLTYYVAVEADSEFTSL